MNILFIAVLVSAIFSADPATNQNEKSQCKREVVETYNLNGYMNPRAFNFYLCPAMKMTCCSPYDQFMIFTTWHENIKPKLEEYYAGINSKMKRIKQLLKIIFKTDVKALVEKMHAEQKVKDEVLQKFMLLKDKDLVKMTEQVMQLFESNKEFMMQVRSTFHCTICDYTSHRYIDVDEKTMTINEGSCGELAMSTINFSYFLNVELAKYLTDLSKLLLNFSISGTEAPVRIKTYSKIRRFVTQCANVFKSGSSDIKQCKKYCEYFKLNANSPVIEGYQVFFNQITNGLEIFLKAYPPEDGKKDDDDEDEENTRLLEQKDASGKSSPNNSKGGNDASNNDDVPTMDIANWDFNNQVDFYDEKAVDPNYDEYVLNKMFNFEKDYVKDRHVGYVNFIKNKLHLTDVEYDFENASDDNNLFKTNSKVIVDLENFATKVRPHGLDFSNHIYTTNIDKTMKELISNLKSRSKYKILYEKLDPTLLAQVNDISNEDVKNFHRDNYLVFTDFGLPLTKEVMINNYENVKNSGNRKGYSIH